MTHFKMEFQVESDIAIHVDKNTSPNSIKISCTDANGEFVLIDPDLFTNTDEVDIATFIRFKKDQNVAIEYPVEHSVVKMQGSLKESSKVEKSAEIPSLLNTTKSIEKKYFARIMRNELVNSKSLYAHSNHVMFITK